MEPTALRTSLAYTLDSNFITKLVSNIEIFAKNYGALKDILSLFFRIFLNLFFLPYRGLSGWVASIRK